MLQRSSGHGSDADLAGRTDRRRGRRAADRRRNLSLRSGSAPSAEYAFRHPLIRTVAYESQLKSIRAQSHRRLAAAIEHGCGLGRRECGADRRTPRSGRGFAGRLRLAHGRRDGFAFRDMRAAHTGWRRAREVADRLPEDDCDRLTKAIAPRTLLCAQAYRVGGSGAETGFEELRELCIAADDRRSLAMGMAGLMTCQTMKGHRWEASSLPTNSSGCLRKLAIPH